MPTLLTQESIDQFKNALKAMPEGSLFHGDPEEFIKDAKENAVDDSLFKTKAILQKEFEDFIKLMQLFAEYHHVVSDQQYNNKIRLEAELSMQLPAAFRGTIEESVNQFIPECKKYLQAAEHFSIILLGRGHRYSEREDVQLLIESLEINIEFIKDQTNAAKLNNLIEFNKKIQARADEKLFHHKFVLAGMYTVVMGCAITLVGVLTGNPLLTLAGATIVLLVGLITFAYWYGAGMRENTFARERQSFASSFKSMTKIAQRELSCSAKLSKGDHLSKITNDFAKTQKKYAHLLSDQYAEVKRRLDLLDKEEITVQSFKLLEDKRAILTAALLRIGSEAKTMSQSFKKLCQTVQAKTTDQQVRAAIDADNNAVDNAYKILETDFSTRLAAATKSHDYNPTFYQKLDTLTNAQTKYDAKLNFLLDTPNPIDLYLRDYCPESSSTLKSSSKYDFVDEELPPINLAVTLKALAKRNESLIQQAFQPVEVDTLGMQRIIKGGWTSEITNAMFKLLNKLSPSLAHNLFETASSKMVKKVKKKNVDFNRKINSSSSHPHSKVKKTYIKP